MQGRLRKVAREPNEGGRLRKVARESKGRRGNQIALFVTTVRCAVLGTGVYHLEACERVFFQPSYGISGFNPSSLNGQ